MEHIISDEAADEKTPNDGADRDGENKHKDKGEGKRKLDEADRRKVGVELEKNIYVDMLVVCHQRNMDVADVLQFDLSSVHPALMDECGYLREGGESVLAVSLPRLHLLQTWSLLTPGNYSTTFSGQSPALQNTWLQTSALDWPTTPEFKQIVLFDQEAPSTNDHKQTRRGIAPNTLLPCR